MKHLYLLFFIAISFVACSKDDFDRNNPKNGQEVELFIDHYRSWFDSQVFLNTNRNEKLLTNVENFGEREIGYTYVIKARVVEAPAGLVDVPSYWFEYIRTIRKDKYLLQDTLALPLFGFFFESYPFCLRKDGDKYYYSDDLLSPASAAVKSDLDKAFAKGIAILTSGEPRKPITIYVKHDPDNYGKGYVVYRVQL